MLIKKEYSQFIHKVIAKIRYTRVPYRIYSKEIFILRFSVGAKPKLWLLTQYFYLKISSNQFRFISRGKLVDFVPESFLPILYRCNPRFLDVIDYSISQIKKDLKSNYLKYYDFCPYVIDKFNFFIKGDCVVISIKKGDHGAYGHFLAEYFPAILFLQKLFPLMLSTPRDSAYNKLLVSFANTYGIKCSSESLCDSEQIDFSILIKKYNIKVSDDYQYPSFLGLKVMTDNLEFPDNRPVRNKYIYVARKIGTSSGRCLLNNEILVENLVGIGFDVVFPEDYTFQEQVSLFAEAKIVVGVSGSGLQNCMFCQEGATVVEITPDIDYRPGVLATAIFSKCDYKLIVGSSLEGYLLDGKPQYFSVDLDQILSVLDPIVCANSNSFKNS